jgi:hypothetical protein
VKISKSNIFTIALLLLAGFLLSTGCAAGASSSNPRGFYVATGGHDDAMGTAQAPLRTLSAALKRDTTGQAVYLESGRFAAAEDLTRSPATVHVVGKGPGKTTVAGVHILGATNLTISDVAFTAPVFITHNPTLHARAPARNIEVEHSTMTGTGQMCVTVRDGSRRVRIFDNTMRGCAMGVVGPGNAELSSEIGIEGNRIEDMTADGIQFGDWSDVTIARNRIHHIVDPRHVIHNDGILITGAAHDVAIDGNQISESLAQLLLIQPAVGPISDVRVTNNLMVGAGGVAIQNQGAYGSVFTHNTVWQTRYGGLWLLEGFVKLVPAGRIVPTDTIVEDNILSSIIAIQGARAARAKGNVVPCSSAPNHPTSATLGYTCVSTPGFVDEARGDFRLASGAQARRITGNAQQPPGVGQGKAVLDR